MIKTNKVPSKFLPWVVITVVLLLVGGGLLYIFYGQPKPASDSQMSASDTPATEAPTAENLPAAQTAQPEQAKPGEYVDYSQDYYDQVASTNNRRVLFFHANWCPQCRALENDIKAVGVPDGIVIFKVDYDTANELRQKYGVTLQTTLVEVDTNGNLIKKHVAYNEPTLKASLQALGN